MPVNQIKIQGLKNIEAYKSTDKEGNETWVGKEGADAYFFMEDSMGDKYTQIWDDPDGYNRAWVSRHVGYRRAEFRLDDENLLNEILAIADKPYKVELSEEEQLEREIRDKQRKLESIKAQKVEEDKLPPKRRGRKKSQGGVDGIDKPASNVD